MKKIFRVYIKEEYYGFWDVAAKDEEHAEELANERLESGDDYSWVDKHGGSYGVDYIEELRPEKNGTPLTPYLEKIDVPQE